MSAERSHRRAACGALALSLAFAAAAWAQEPAEPEAPVEAPAPDEPAQAAPPRERKPAIRRIEVLRRPTEAETSGLYPAEALKRAKVGKATMTCEIALTTRLQNCVVESEDPPGFGFGAALLQSAEFYRVSPPAVDGEPVKGAKVSIPMRFELSLETAAKQMDAERAQAKQERAETPAQRERRLGPLKRSVDVLWAPLMFGVFALMGLGSALFWPLAAKRRRVRPGHFA